MILFILFNLFFSPASDLAGENEKSWYVHSQTPDEGHATCQASNPINLDNTWTFYTNGTFTFDHGAIIADNSCQGEDCCTDIGNITGTWQLSNNNTHLVLFAQHETGNPSNAFNENLITATVTALDSQHLIISMTDPNTNVVSTLEFRPKQN